MPNLNLERILDADASQTLQRKKDAVRHYHAITTLENERLNLTIDEDARKVIKENMITQIPELGLIDAIISNQCKSIIALIIPGGTQLGIKSMNDSLIGYNLNNTYIVNNQKKILSDSFYREFNALCGREHKMVVIANNFKGIVLGTTITDKATLFSITKKVLQLLDVKMNLILKEGLQAGLSVWKNKQAKTSNAPLRPIEIEAEQRTYNIEKALECLASPDWIFEAHIGISRVHDFNPKKNSFEEMAYYALEAYTKAQQGRALARAEFNEEQRCDRNAANNRICLFDKDAVLYLAKRCEDLRNKFFSINKSTLIDQGGVKLPLLKKIKNVWDINPDMVRLHRKGQFIFTGLNISDKSCLSAINHYLDISRIFASMPCYTYSELPKVYRNLEESFKLLKSLDLPEVLSSKHIKIMKKNFNKDISGHVMTEFNRTSGLKFFDALDESQHRIYMNVDVIDLGLVGRLRAVAELHNMAINPVLDDKDFFERVIKTSAPSIKIRRMLYRQTTLAYIQVLTSLRDQHDKSLIDNEIKAARSGALTLIAGDEITLSIHPMMRPYITSIIRKLIKRNNIRIAISEAIPNQQDFHETAMHQADAGISVLKLYESNLFSVLMQMKLIKNPKQKKVLKEKLHRCKAASLYAYINPDDKITLLLKNTGEEMSSQQINHEIDLLTQMTQRADF